MAWLRLIRWKNLLIVFLTQLLVWWCVIVPLGRHTDTPLLLGFKNFLLLSLSTVFIAAAGYIINDYFDVKIDVINRPEKMVLEKIIPRRHGIIFHTVLNVAGIFLAFLVAGQAGHYEWLWMQIICSLLLWFYSTHFKRMFITGNVVVALLTAFTILVLIIYEPAIYVYIHKDILTETSQGYIYLNPAWLLGVYIYFAFMLTWMREIVKDMEDYKGDAEEGCLTMPIRWGLQRSSGFTRMLGALAVLPLLLADIYLVTTGNYLLGGYTFIAVIIPLVYWIYTLGKAATTQHYAKASRQIKLIMLSGVGTLIINYIQEWLKSY